MPGQADRASAEGDPSASSLLTGDAVEDRRSIEILLDTIAAVTGNLELDSVLRLIVDRSLLVTRAERAILFLGDSPEALSIRVARNRDGRAMDKELQYSRSIVRKTLEEGLAVRSVVQNDEEALQLGQSVFDLKLRAVMCAPLVADDRTLGVIYVDSRAQRREFSSRDLALFGAISQQLAISLENARLHADSLEKARLQQDIQLLQRIQQHLLPPVPQDVQGLDIACRYLAAEQASGDTYDFVTLRDGRLAVMIGDVSGHGIGPALLNHAAQAALRSYLELIDDPSDVVRRLNNRLVAAVEAGNFLSLLLCVIDPKERTVRYVNAGHPGLLVCGEGGVRCLEKTGMVLGVQADQDYGVSDPVPMSSGDLLFLHTDGVDEARAPGAEPFGSARLAELLQGLRSKSAEEVVRGVRATLTSHARGQLKDDFTVIAVKVL